MKIYKMNKHINSLDYFYSFIQKKTEMYVRYQNRENP